MTAPKHCPCCPHYTPMRKKRPNGTGSLFFRTQGGYWVAAVVLKSGKRLVSAHKQLTDAEAALSRLCAEKARLDQQAARTQP